MSWPFPRLLAGDRENGYTYARTANTDVCQDLPRGNVLTPAMVGGSASIDYVITAAHRGGCTIFLNRGNGWETIGSDPTCGMSERSSSITVNIPAGSYNAVLRWYYQSDNNNGAIGEVFNNCADITVSPSGTNAHTTESTSTLQRCDVTNDLTCTGANAYRGWQQCAAGFWNPKTCPVGTYCIQTRASNPAANLAGEIACGSAADFAAANGGKTPDGPAPAPAPAPSPSPSRSPSRVRVRVGCRVQARRLHLHLRLHLLLLLLLHPPLHLLLHPHPHPRLHPRQFLRQRHALDRRTAVCRVVGTLRSSSARRRGLGR
ncbi:hypothetical protein BC829DRAFT_50513 [Chytridium lagenaria]|nr:hypothetical protein BC829DRAFT_50513 [Chytridium lagenaria]